MGLDAAGIERKREMVGFAAAAVGGGEALRKARKLGGEGRDHVGRNGSFDNMDLDGAGRIIRQLGESCGDITASEVERDLVRRLDVCGLRRDVEA